MAFVQTPLPEEQQNQFAPTGQTTANPLALLPPQATQTGGSSGQGGGQASGQAPSVGSPTQFGSNASRLSDYLQANQDQVQQMANGIAGNLNTQYGNVQGQIQGLGQGFQNQVNAGYNAPNQSLVDQAMQFPSWFANQPGNVQSFQGQLNDQYKGPQNLEGTNPYSSVQQSIQNAIQQSGTVGTYPGLSTYLQNNAQGQYTPGMNTLDTVLLYGNTPAYQSVQNASSQFGQLPGQLATTAQTADQSVQAAEAAAPAAAQYAANALSNTVGSTNSALQDQLTSAQNAYTNYNTDVGQLRGAAQDINSAIQQFLAQNPNVTVSGNTDFLAPWVNLQEDITAPTLASVSTPQDFANLQALQTLSGGNAAFTTPLDLTQSGQAGTFNLPQDLQAAINNQAIPQAMTNELNAISGQITGAYQPFTTAQQQNAQYTQQYNDLKTQLAQAQQQLKTTPQYLTDANTGAQTLNPQWTTLTNQVNDLSNQTSQAQGNADLAGTTMKNLAPSLQWLPQAGTQYNDLVTRLSADVNNLGGMNVPAFNQRVAPSAAPREAGNAIGTGIGVGAPVGAATGLTAAGVPLTASALGSSGATVAGEVPAAGLSGVGMLGPASLAGYGASNIVQNAAANPITSGLGTLANMGISLATLSLPPSVLSSIGSGISNVINSIGDFFGGLF